MSSSSFEDVGVDGILDVVREFAATWSVAEDQYYTQVQTLVRRAMVAADIPITLDVMRGAVTVLGFMNSYRDSLSPITAQLMKIQGYSDHAVMSFVIGAMVEQFDDMQQPAEELSDDDVAQLLPQEEK